ncbi:MAG: YitT family protein [Lacrimispora sp.]|uniref:YczE/YyaS/YitT family protein n=1 Tax=Lacrimispora sp. TaxID=2719234 RepID=UPI0039E5A7DB
MKSRKKIEKRQIILYLMGILIIPVGVVFTINSHAGAGGFDAMNFVLAKYWGINTSFVIYITSFLIVLVAAGIRRTYPRMVTFVSSALIGFFIDISKRLLEGIEGTGIVSSAVLLVVGMILIGFGVASYIASGLPPNTNDDLVLALREKGVPIGKAKVGFDSICALLAFLLGGEIGWGTIVVTFGLGCVVQFFDGIFGSYGKKAVVN